MAGKAEFPLALVIKAVDKATAPLREVNAKIARMTAPARALGNSFKALSDESGLTKLGMSLGGVGGAVGKVGGEVLKLGKQLALLAAGAGFALFKVIHGSIDAGDKLSEMAQRTGLTVDAYAQLQFAAEQADVSQDQFNSSMDMFNKGVGQAKAGAGRFLAFLQKVSPVLAKQIRHSKSNEEALNLMTSAFTKVTDPAKRAALATAAFGDPQMGQFLGQGSEAINEYRKTFEKLAGPQQEFADRSSKADNALRDASIAFLGLRNSAVTGLMPALVTLAGALSNVLSGNRANLAAWAEKTGKAIQDWVSSGGVERLAKSLGDAAQTIGKVIDMLGGLKGVAIVTATYLSSDLLLSILKLGGAFWKLGSAALPLLIRAAMVLWPVLVALGTALAPFVLAAAPFIAAAVGIGAAAWQIYKNWEPLKEFFSELWDGIVAKVSAAVETLKPLMETVWKYGRWAVPGYAVAKGAEWAGEKMGLFGSTEKPAQLLSSTTSPAAQTSRSQAYVQVEFANMPKGARVTEAQSNTADLEISRGVSMGAH